MYNPFELSTYVAFDSLLHLEDKFAVPSEKNERLFVERKFDETKILENTIETVCFNQDYNEDYYPVIFGFARGITRVFYTTPLNSKDIIEDVVNLRQESIVIAEMKKEQLAFLKQADELLNYCKIKMVGMNLSTFYDTERRKKVASNIFTRWRPQLMTDEEYGHLVTLGDQADKVKKPPSPYLITSHLKVS